MEIPDLVHSLRALPVKDLKTTWTSHILGCGIWTSHTNKQETNECMPSTLYHIKLYYKRVGKCIQDMQDNATFHRELVYQMNCPKAWPAELRWASVHQPNKSRDDVPFLI